MKKLIFALLTLFCTTSLIAQIPSGGITITGRISGTIIDSLTKKPLDYASVSLGRSSSKKNTNGALTDNKGVFKIDNVSPNTYRLTISFMGYKTKIIDPVTTTPEKPDINLGEIILTPNQKMLDAVVVQGQATVIENKVDKMVYNAEKDATVTGGNATDVLRKVPMVSVDQDGNVALRGDQNVRVLINGKPSGAVASNVGDAMQMLPADQIKSVEVITSPSAKYDAEGSGGIINIITKSKSMSGVSGSINGGLGIIQNNGNANLNINHNRLSVVLNTGGNFGWPRTSNISFYSKNNTFTSEQSGESTLQRYAWLSTGKVSYDINNSNSISSSIRVNQGGFSTKGSSINKNLSENFGLREYTVNNDNRRQIIGFDWDIDYTKKFKKEGHELVLAGQWSQTSADVDFTTLYSGNTTNLPVNLAANNDAGNNEYTAQIDYSLPITDKIKLETGVKSIIREINSDYVVYSNNSIIPDATLSNQYDYQQDVMSGYASLNFQLKNKWGIQAGARLENTQINGNARNLTAGLVPFKNTYNNFIPNITISKIIKNNTLKLSYNQRIQRPGFRFLNPFRDTGNPQSHLMGNPYLAPEISHTIELGFSTFIKSSVVNASVYFKQTNAIIESIAKPDTYQTVDASGNVINQVVSLTTFDNIGSNQSIGTNIFGSFNPIQKLTLRGNLNLFTYNPTASGSLQSLTATDNKTYVLYNGFLSGSYDLPKNFIIESFLVLNAPRRTFQGANPGFTMWVISMNKSFFNKKAKLGINVVEPFSYRKDFITELNTANIVQKNVFSVPFRSVGINFSWQFGKVRFDQPQPGSKKKGVNNDDLKQGGDGQGVPQ